MGLYDIKTFLSKLGFLEIWYKQEIDRTLFGNFETKNMQEIYANIENSRLICLIYIYMSVFDLRF